MTVDTDKKLLHDATERLYRAGMIPDRIMKIVTDTIAEVVIEKSNVGKTKEMNEEEIEIYKDLLKSMSEEEIQEEVEKLKVEIYRHFDNEAAMFRLMDALRIFITEKQVIEVLEMMRAHPHVIACRGFFNVAEEVQKVCEFLAEE